VPSELKITDFGDPWRICTIGRDRAHPERKAPNKINSFWLVRWLARCAVDHSSKPFHDTSHPQISSTSWHLSIRASDGLTAIFFLVGPSLITPRMVSAQNASKTNALFVWHALLTIQDVTGEIVADLAGLVENVRQ
jgi:hypothetical protein